MENFYFFKGFSYDEFKAYIKKTMGFTVDASKSCKGKFYVLENEKGFTCYLIWVKDPKDASVLAHEACHAATAILSSKGHKIDPENDELFAYYVGLLVRKYGQV